MNLNCRQGDLAVIVHSEAGNEGKIVECLRLELFEHTYRYGRAIKPCWYIGRSIAGWRGDTTTWIADACLRPLRDSEEDDEMLRLVGLPAGSPQAA